MAACILHPLKKPNSEPRVVVWGNISQDGRRLMENGETSVKPNEGAIPSPSGIEEPVQRVDVSDMNGGDDTIRKGMQGRCPETRGDVGLDAVGERDRRKERRTDESGPSTGVDQIRYVANKHDSKL